MATTAIPVQPTILFSQRSFWAFWNKCAFLAIYKSQSLDSVFSFIGSSALEKTEICSGSSDAVMTRR